MDHYDPYQEYELNGNPLKNGGYPCEKGNPPFGTPTRIGGSCVWLFRRTNDGIEVLSQKRAEHIDNGGKWDVSAAGHIDYGETPLEAAIREAKEEIGIEVLPEKLIHILTLPVFPTPDKHKLRNMVNYHYLYDWTGQPDDFHFDDDEVSEVRWISLADFDDFAKASLKSAWRDNRLLLDLIKTWLTYYGDN